MVGERIVIPADLLSRHTALETHLAEDGPEPTWDLTCEEELALYNRIALNEHVLRLALKALDDIDEEVGLFGAGRVAWAEIKKLLHV